MTKKRLRHFERTAVIILGAMLAAGACDDRRRHQPSEHHSLDSVDLPIKPDASAMSVAEQLVRSLGRAQAARSGGLGNVEKKQAYDRALAEITSLAAADAIHQMVSGSRSANVPRDVTQPAAVSLIVESWISLAAHYCDGFQFQSMRCFPENPQSECTVYVDAVSPADKVRLDDIKKTMPALPTSGPAGKGAGDLSNLRSKTLPEGFTVPIEATLELRMKKTDMGWRASRVAWAQASPPAGAARGAVLPTKS